MDHDTRWRRCINPHDGWAIQYFDPAESDSELPTFFCCSACEHDWVASRLQPFPSLDAVESEGLTLPLRSVVGTEQVPRGVESDQGPQRNHCFCVKFVSALLGAGVAQMKNWVLVRFDVRGPGVRKVMKLGLLVSVLTISVLTLRVPRLFAAVEMYKPFPARPETREIRDEADPTDQQTCDSMGQISLAYESGEVGPSNLGLRITDPRGRKIGYDPMANRGWQELPLAEAFFDCDENEDTGELRHCVGHIRICGPISGSYQVEVLPTHSCKYSISVSGRSQETRDEHGVRSTGSRVELKSEIQERAPAMLLLQYSREGGARMKLTLSEQPAPRPSACCSSRPTSP